MPAPALLLYAASAHNADQLYFGRVSVPDAYISIGLRGKKYAFVNALEFSRVRRDSAYDVVLALEPYLKKARACYPEQKIGAAEVITLFATEKRVRDFRIPEDFPAGLASRLTAHGLRLEVADGPLFPARALKTPAEAKAIREGNRCSALGFAAAERLLRTSKIVSGKIHYKGAPLTSEMLKFAIEVACLEAGAVSTDTIVAGGDQACDPHERGHGPLRAAELIIIDIFPRVQATGYHGDMTRTFLKGRPSEAQRALVAAVREAQLAALQKIRAGINGRDVHQQCLDVFAKRGYETKTTAKGSVGFFHGTGHGLGLDIHEAPRVSITDHLLASGTVVTVEPGLYYPGLGACRIEDVVQVTATRPKLLSDYHYEWELK